METLLIFLAIAAIQMIAAYKKQKKEAEKKEAHKYEPPPEEKQIPEPFFESKPSLEWELESDLKPVHVYEIPHPHTQPQPQPHTHTHTQPHTHPVSYADTPLKAGNFVQNNSQFSNLHSLLNIKNPAQGILWAAILHEPRYRVKWKQR